MHAPPLTISIVSHGHEAWLERLLPELARSHAGLIAEVVVTHNLPAAPLRNAGWPFALRQLHNDAPRGFGANHNRALAAAQTPLLCILNPDMSLPDDTLWPTLVQCATQEHHAGCVVPQLLNPDRSNQDNLRAVPTPLALLRRRLLRQPDRRVDWASGAFWVVPRPVFAALGGFDERYFMYCEDVDFCLRVQLAGHRLLCAPAQAMHHAQRSSHRRWRHLAWHLQSLVRLWCSPVLRAYLARPTHPEA
jgi:N-acetylglucosaminyl-diphospho-decaprenol L-rhamnosyltransferase